MLHDVVEVRALGGYRLYLRFDDGKAGELDLGSRLTFDGVFAPLRDAAVFAQARVHPELGTVVWPSGADVDPDVLHAALTGTDVTAELAGPRAAV